MTQDEFSKQISRLRDQWKTAYGEAKVGIIWQEFQRLPNDTFTKIVDYFLGEFRQPPVLSDFRKALAGIREEYYAKQKQEFKNTSEQFWSGRLHDDEIKGRSEMIKNRALGLVPDKEWGDFLKFLDSESAKGGK